MKHDTIGAFAIAGAIALTFGSAAAAVVTFETVPLGASGYYNGSDLSGGVVLEGATFKNTYNSIYQSWSGFAVSNKTDVTTSGYLNQYSAYTGGGAASANYAVGYYSTYDAVSTNVTLSGLTNLAGKGALITNTTYAVLDMLSGSGEGGSKAFGGGSGNDADFLLLTIQGYAAGLATGIPVNFYLADYRFTNNSQDYIVDDWQFVDFSALGSVDEIRFSMTSSDNNQYGSLTPTYFAMDNFLAVPESSSLLIAISGLGLLARRRR